MNMFFSEFLQNSSPKSSLDDFSLLYVPEIRLVSVRILLLILLLSTLPNYPVFHLFFV